MWFSPPLLVQGKASSLGELTFPVDSPAGVVRPSLCQIAKALTDFRGLEGVVAFEAFGFSRLLSRRLLLLYTGRLCPKQSRPDRP